MTMKPLRPLFALWMVPLAAMAQARDPVTAEALFRQGREAIKAGRLDEGCAKLTESQRLDPAPGTLLNVADCEEKQGKLATARQHLLDVLDALPASDDRRALAQKKADALAGRIPRLTVRLAAGAPEGTRVSRDGVALGAAALGSPLPVDPGLHAIEATAPGRAVGRVEVTLAERETREVTVAPGPPEAAPSASSAPVASASAPPSMPTASASSAPLAPLASSFAVAPPPAARTTSTAGWLLVGGGGVAVGVSLFLGLKVLDRKSTVETHCPNKACDQDGLDAASSGRTLSNASTALFAVGLVAAGAGTYLLLTTPRASVSAGPGSIQARVTF